MHTTTNTTAKTKTANTKRSTAQIFEVRMLRNALYAVNATCGRIYADKTKKGYSCKIYATTATAAQLQQYLVPGYYLTQQQLLYPDINILRLHKK